MRKVYDKSLEKFRLWFVDRLLRNYDIDPRVYLIDQLTRLLECKPELFSRIKIPINKMV